MAADISNLVNHERLRQALSQARTSTAVEIAPIVVGSSGRYDKAEDLLGLWAAAIGLALMWLFFAKVPFASSMPLPKSGGSSALASVLLTIAVGFGAGALIMTQIGRLRRMFVPRSQLLQTVQSRAQQAFNELHVQHRKEPFVLLFVSTYEQAACVMPSDALKDKLAPADLESLRGILESHMRYNVDEALMATIRQIGRLLNTPQDNACKAPAASDTPAGNPLAVTKC